MLKKKVILVNEGKTVTEEMKRSGDQYRKRLCERTEKNKEKKR